LRRRWRRRRWRRRLRVSRKSAYAWHRAWADGGRPALAPESAGGARCLLSEEQLDRLEAELDAGPAAHGWEEDQRWTLARVAVLIWELFRVRYTVRGVSYLLHRIGIRRRCRCTGPRSGMRRRWRPG
jgi:transposase